MNNDRFHQTLAANVPVCCSSLAKIGVDLIGYMQSKSMNKTEQNYSIKKHLGIIVIKKN